MLHGGSISDSSFLEFLSQKIFPQKMIFPHDFLNRRETLCQKQLKAFASQNLNRQFFWQRNVSKPISDILLYRLVHTRWAPTSCKLAYI